MQVQVLKTFRWAHDGVNITVYQAGEEPIELSDPMAARAIRNGWVKPIDTKSLGQSPENKAMLTVAENKLKRRKNAHPL